MKRDHGQWLVDDDIKLHHDLITGSITTHSLKVLWMTRHLHTEWHRPVLNTTLGKKKKKKEDGFP